MTRCAVEELECRCPEDAAGAVVQDGQFERDTGQAAALKCQAAVVAFTVSHLPSPRCILPPGCQPVVSLGNKR